MDMSNTSSPPREISRVGVLDLTGPGAAEALDGVSRISRVGVILAPASVLPRLARIELDRVGATVPIPEGEHMKVHVHTGQTISSGAALANPNGGPQDVMVVTGQLVITSPVESVGYGHLVVTGQVVAPAGSETALSAGLSTLTGQALYYPYQEGWTIKLLSGHARLSGASMANPAGSASDVLLAIEDLVVSGPIEDIGYAQLVCLGAMLLPRVDEPRLVGRAWGDPVVFYSAPPRVFSGVHHFDRTFFEFLDERITWVLSGVNEVADDVTPDLIKEKVADIVVSGRLRGPRVVLSAIQALASVCSGKVEPNGAPEDDA